MNYQTLKDLLTVFLALKTEQVLDVFADMPGAIVAKHYVYVPGDDTSLPLLCAHADTVWNDNPAPIEWIGDTGASSDPIMDGKARRGIGADDRCGIAAVYAMRENAGGVLITDLEEVGGIGARAAAKEIPDLLARHGYMIQVDRRGTHEGVFYGGTSSKRFSRFLKDNLEGWTFGQGSYTDIATICPAVDRCGVNLAAGYWNEHTSRERVEISALLATVDAIGTLLAQGAREFRPNPDYGFMGRYSRYTGRSLGWADWLDETADPYSDNRTPLSGTYDPTPEDQAWLEVDGIAEPVYLPIIDLDGMVWGYTDMYTDQELAQGYVDEETAPPECIWHPEVAFGAELFIWDEPTYQQLVSAGEEPEADE